ncbi:MAG: TetR/AcrR family transcriptional regulator [Phycisphaerales bacterium]|nr:TetR/AcrR family transcriptional regulator [Phycisphaerales bacterium]
MPPEPPTPPATRLPAAERRDSILDAAELVFVRSGYHGTTTRDLAQACGVTEPVLYRHFAGKDDLFVAVVTRMIDDAIDTVMTPGSPGSRDRAIQRALEAVLLADHDDAAMVVRERRSDLESAFATTGNRDGGEELAKRLGMLILERLDGDA